MWPKLTSERDVSALVSTSTSASQPVCYLLCAFSSGEYSLCWLAEIDTPMPRSVRSSSDGSCRVGRLSVTGTNRTLSLLLFLILLAESAARHCIDYHQKVFSPLQAETVIETGGKPLKQRKPPQTCQLISHIVFFSQSIPKPLSTPFQIVHLPQKRSPDKHIIQLLHVIPRKHTCAPPGTYTS